MSRKQKKYHYIYKTTCEVTSRYYYGMHSTDNLNDGYIGSGTRLWHSINYHGKENHSIEILEYLDDRISLKNREKELITEEMLKDPMCMNLVSGGNGGCTAESQKKRSIAGGNTIAFKLKNDPDFKRKHAERCSKYMKQLHIEGKIKYDTFTGRTHSEEAKKKMSEADRTRSKNSQFGTCWIYNEIESIKIKKDKLESYVNSGWTKGRKLNKQ